MRVTVYGLSRRLTVRRYVDIPKLFELLALGRSYFPTLGTLAKTDPFESGIHSSTRYRKATRQELRSRAMDLASFLPEELRGPDRQDHLARYFELVERCSIQQLKAVILDMEARECRERIVCNCWHAGKCESDAMWKLYGNQLGVALVSTVGRLARSFKGRYSQIVCAPDPQEYTMASVRYVDESKLGKLDDFHVKHWWLLKRNSFAHESEIRVFHRLSNAVDAHDGGIQIDVDVQQMIEEIVLNPFNPRWVSEALRAAILLILEKNNLKIHVGQSAHAKPPTASNPILATIEIDRLRASFGVKRRKPH